MSSQYWATPWGEGPNSISHNARDNGVPRRDSLRVVGWPRLVDQLELGRKTVGPGVLQQAADRVGVQVLDQLADALRAGGLRLVRVGTLAGKRLRRRLALALRPAETREACEEAETGNAATSEGGRRRADAPYLFAGAAGVPGDGPHGNLGGHLLGPLLAVGHHWRVDAVAHLHAVLEPGQRQCALNGDGTDCRQLLQAGRQAECFSFLSL